MDGQAVALIYHFDTMVDAQIAMKRLAQLGGLCECAGHLWDEDENTGFVAVDAWDGTLFTKECAHILLAPAVQDAEQAEEENPHATPDVFALLPLHLLSGEECEERARLALAEEE